MWKLMTDDAITAEERKDLSEFILSTDKLSQGETVKLFEERWSQWLGCKYSVFVNSGSSANLMLVRALSNLKNWVAQSCTWSTTISPVIQNDGNLTLCDIDLQDFSPNLVELEKIFKEQKIECLFLTHLLGFCALSDELLDLCDKYGVTLLEDCCEAHGATFKGKKVGTYGRGSSFSFYYGHHMTTIEGGMVCTDDEDLYHELLLLRSHGLLRELPEKERKAREVSKVNPSFCFLRDGYNLRNTEINARLGVLQLPHLDTFIDHRNYLLGLFLENLNSDKFYTDFKLAGCSNFAFPIFVKHPALMTKVCEALYGAEVEYRPCIAGNLHNHPLTSALSKEYSDENAEKVHQSCIYVGNHKDITKDDILSLCNLLNSL
tara:strand:+ start:5077 stop:6204 length:1128 start_codon:yes stop_codon:yes gene_type:complete